MLASVGKSKSSSQRSGLGSRRSPLQVPRSSDLGSSTFTFRRHSDFLPASSTTILALFPPTSSQRLEWYSPDRRVHAVRDRRTRKALPTVLASGEGSSFISRGHATFRGRVRAPLDLVGGSQRHGNGGAAGCKDGGGLVEACSLKKVVLTSEPRWVQCVCALENAGRRLCEPATLKSERKTSFASSSPPVTFSPSIATVYRPSAPLHHVLPLPPHQSHVDCSSPSPLCLAHLTPAQLLRL